MFIATNVFNNFAFGVFTTIDDFLSACKKEYDQDPIKLEKGQLVWVGDDQTSAEDGWWILDGEDGEKIVSIDVLNVNQIIPDQWWS